jgi:hypothetical protein
MPPGKLAELPTPSSPSRPAQAGGIQKFEGSRLERRLHRVPDRPLQPVIGTRSRDPLAHDDDPDTAAFQNAVPARFGFVSSNSVSRGTATIRSAVIRLRSRRSTRNRKPWNVKL